MGGELVDPPFPLREVRRPRRDVAGVDHQRWAAEPFTELLDRVVAGRRRVERIRARLPRHQPRRRHVLRVAELGDRAWDLVVVAPRVQLHGADRHAAGHQGLHCIGDAGTDRPTGFGAIPVGGPVVRPVRQVRRDRVGVPGPPPAPRTNRITPPLEHLCHRVTLEDAERGREAGRDVVEIPVPSPAKRAVGNGDHLLVRMVQRGQPDVAPADTAQQHPQHRRRVQVGSRVEVEVEQRAGDHGQRELRVREAEELRLARDLERDVGARSPRTSRWRSRSAPRSRCNRSRCQPSPTDRSTTTPSGTTSSPIRTSASTIADIFAARPPSVAAQRSLGAPGSTPGVTAHAAPVGRDRSGVVHRADTVRLGTVAWW